MILKFGFSINIEYIQTIFINIDFKIVCDHHVDFGKKNTKKCIQNEYSKGFFVEGEMIAYIYTLPVHRCHRRKSL